GGPHPGEDLGDARHAAPAARRRATALVRGARHQPPVCETRTVAEVLRHHDGRARSFDGGGRTGAGWPRHDGRRTGAGSWPAHRVRGICNETCDSQLGYDPEAGGVCGAPVFRPKYWQRVQFTRPDTWLAGAMPPVGRPIHPDEAVAEIT